MLELQPKNYEASIGLGVALRGNKKIDAAETQYNAAQRLDPSQRVQLLQPGPALPGLQGRPEAVLQKAQDYYRQFLGHASGATSESLKSEAEKRIKDIDEIYVALEEAAKMQAEAEEMQRKAEAQQKEMEEKMKKQEADEKAAADKAAADKAAADKAAVEKTAADRTAATKAAVEKGAAGDKAAAGRCPRATSPQETRSPRAAKRARRRSRDSGKL